MMKRLIVARTLLAMGLLVGLVSWWITLQHITDPAFALIPAFENGASHARYHVFREAGGDVAAMLVLILLFFGPQRFRTKESWLTALLIMVGYYAPFWIGSPFHEGLVAPSFAAELVHVAMASLSITALFVAKPLFRQVKENVRAVRLDKRYVSGQQITQ